MRQATVTTIKHPLLWTGQSRTDTDNESILVGWALPSDFDVLFCNSKARWRWNGQAGCKTLRQKYFFTISFTRINIQRVPEGECSGSELTDQTTLARPPVSFSNICLAVKGRNELCASASGASDNTLPYRTLIRGRGGQKHMRRPGPSDLPTIMSEKEQAQGTLDKAWKRGECAWVQWEPHLSSPFHTPDMELGARRALGISQRPEGTWSLKPDLLQNTGLLQINIDTFNLCVTFLLYVANCLAIMQLLFVLPFYIWDPGHCVDYTIQYYTIYNHSGFIGSITSDLESQLSSFEKHSPNYIASHSDKNDSRTLKFWTSDLI